MKNKDLFSGVFHDHHERLELGPAALEPEPGPALVCYSPCVLLLAAGAAAVAADVGSAAPQDLIPGGRKHCRLFVEAVVSAIAVGQPCVATMAYTLRRWKTRVCSSASISSQSEIMSSTK